MRFQGLRKISQRSCNAWRRYTDLREFRVDLAQVRIALGRHNEAFRNHVESTIQEIVKRVFYLTAEEYIVFLIDRPKP